jgi:hypothetical protein
MRWVRRLEAERHAGLLDRRCCPRHQPSRTPRRRLLQVLAVRRQYWTMERIAAFVGVDSAPRATGGRIWPA